MCTSFWGEPRTPTVAITARGSGLYQQFMIPVILVVHHQL